MLSSLPLSTPVTTLSQHVVSNIKTLPFHYSFKLPAIKVLICHFLSLSADMYHAPMTTKFDCTVLYTKTKYLTISIEIVLILEYLLSVSKIYIGDYSIFHTTLPQPHFQNCKTAQIAVGISPQPLDHFP